MRKATIQSTLVALAADAVVLAVYWYFIPELKRPFEGLMAVVFGLSAATAAAAKPAWLKSAAIFAAALAACIFGLEMAQKFFNIANLFEKNQALAQGTPSRYSYNGMETASYFAAIDRALEDGIDPAVFNADFAGDVFAGVPESELRVRTTRRGDRLERMISVRESPYIRETPLGVELRPSFKFREVAEGETVRRTVWDGVTTTTDFGSRHVRCNEESPDVYLFMGCSMMFGMNLSDHQTTPYFFSEAHGFDKRVINTAVGGNGPHHALRDLELNLRPGRAGVRDSQVRGVYYWLLGDHAKRVNSVFPPGSPRYALENGKAVYKGTFADTDDFGRWGIMMSRSRIYPLLRDKLLRKSNTGDLALLHAVMAEMHRICLERYGVPLTVLTWDVSPATDRALREMGVRLVPAADVFGSDWVEKGVLYRLPDSHATVYANRLIGQYLYALDQRGN